MFTFANPGLSGKLPIRSIPYSSIQFHHETLITSIAKDFKGSITLLVITPSGDSLANTANLQMMEKPGGLIRRALGVIPRNMGDHFFALYF